MTCQSLALTLTATILFAFVLARTTSAETNDRPQWAMYGFSAERNFVANWSWTVGVGDGKNGSDCPSDFAVVHKTIVENPGIWAQASPIVDQEGHAVVYWVNEGNRTLIVKAYGTKFDDMRDGHHKLESEGVLKWNLTAALEFTGGGDRGDQPSMWGWQAVLLEDHSIVFPMTVRNKSATSPRPYSLVVSFSSTQRAVWSAPTWSRLLNCSNNPTVLPWNDALLLTCGGDGGDAGLHMLNSSTGTTLWHTQYASLFSRAAAPPASASPSQHLWAWGQDRRGCAVLLRFNASTGQKDYEFAFPSPCHYPLPVVINSRLDIVTGAVGSELFVVYNSSTHNASVLTNRTVVRTLTQEVVSVNAIGGHSRGWYLVECTNNSYLFHWNSTGWIADLTFSLPLSETVPVSSINGYVLFVPHPGAKKTKELHISAADWSAVVNQDDRWRPRWCSRSISKHARPLPEINLTGAYVSHRWYSMAISSSQAFGFIVANDDDDGGAYFPALFAVLDKNQDSGQRQADTYWIVIAAVGGFVIIVAPILLSIVGVLCLGIRLWTGAGGHSRNYMPLNPASASSAPGHPAKFGGLINESNDRAIVDEFVDHSRSSFEPQVHLSLSPYQHGTVKMLLSGARDRSWFIPSEDLVLDGVKDKDEFTTTWTATWSSSALFPGSPTRQGVPASVLVTELHDVVIVPGLEGVADMLTNRLSSRMEQLVDLRHDNIAGTFGATYSSTYTSFAVVSERTDAHSFAGTLVDLLLSPSRLDVYTMHGLLSDVARAMTFLHERGIVHGGLHPSDVLVFSSPSYAKKDYPSPVNAKAVLSSPTTTLYGVQRHVQQAVAQAVVDAERQHAHAGGEGSLSRRTLRDIDLQVKAEIAAVSFVHYPMDRLSRVAPGTFIAAVSHVNHLLELFDGTASHPTYASDVYAYGMLIWDILTHGDLVPFDGLSRELIAAEIVAGKRPGLGDGVSRTGQLYELLQQCWHPDPDGRPDFNEICDILADWRAIGDVSWRWWQEQVV